MKSSTANFLVLAFGLAVFAPKISAQTVAWGTSVSFNPLAFNSDGSVDNSGNLWTLGYFNTGFTPDATNWSQWASNWHAVSSPTSETNPLPPYNQVNYPRHRDEGGLWAVSVNTYSVPDPVAAAKQMYVFAYNDLTKLGTPAGEALLYRQDGLKFTGEAAGQATFDIADNPLDNGQTGNDDTFTVIWGRVDRKMYDAGGVLTGGGVIHNLVPDSIAQPPDQLNGTFEAQFATWVPEPASALLVAFGGALAALRRRREV